jgi:hypothetical protein
MKSNVIKRSALGSIYRMLTSNREGFIGGRGVKTRFSRPCLNCGRDHDHNNAFCSAACCHHWRSNNPCQGRV